MTSKKLFITTSQSSQHFLAKNLFKPSYNVQNICISFQQSFDWGVSFSNQAANIKRTYRIFATVNISVIPPFLLSVRGHGKFIPLFLIKFERLPPRKLFLIKLNGWMRTYSVTFKRRYYIQWTECSRYLTTSIVCLLTLEGASELSLCTYTFILVVNET